MSGSRERFGHRALRDRLSRLPRPAQRYWVAYSGGADSTALLHALVGAAPDLPSPVTVLHVNHALHPDAAAWATHCAEVCRKLALPFVTERVTWIDKPTANLEERAREARYAIAERCMAPDDVLLTAHQRDDQAETLLLALLRGSGVDGLAAMAPARPLGRGWLARPLLDFGRDDLTGWLRERSIGWLEDPSNTDTRHDRNHLRRVVIPALTERWPAAPAALARSAALCRETARTLGRWAREGLEAAVDGPVLDLDKLAARDEAEVRFAVRAWLRENDAGGLPGARLRSFVAQALGARADAAPECAWNGWRLHAWDARLWLSRDGAWEAPAATPWRTDAPLCLAGAGGTLSYVGAPPPAAQALTVRPRRPGDRIRAAGASHHRRVKDLLREWRIPPWMRDAVPIVEDRGEPVAVADRVLHERLAGPLGGGDEILRWTPGDPALARAWERGAEAPVDPSQPLG